MKNENNLNEHKYLTNNFIILLLGIICCALWGSAMPCIKIGYEAFQIASDDTWSIVLFAGTRFALAGILVIITTSIMAGEFQHPSKGSWHMIFKVSMAQTVMQYLLFYVGLANLTGTKASIITGSGTFITVLMSCLIFRLEKLGGSKLLGCIIGFAGVIIVNLAGGSDSNAAALSGFSFSLLGEGAILMSTVMSALASILISMYSKKEKPAVISGYQFFMGGLVLSAVALIFGGRLHHITPLSILLLLYMAFISAFAWTVWSILLKYNPVSKVSVYKFLIPVFGVVLSALLLGEHGAFSASTLIALALVSIGIWLVNGSKK